MLRAGANRVVSPFEIGARRMAALVMRPEIVDFIEALSPAKTYGLRLQQIKVGKTSKLSGVRLDKSYIKRDTNGALVLGIEKPSTGMVINPSGGTSLEPGDIMLVIGNDEQINALQKIAAE
jgi:voltage-gated potassium channel